MHDRDGDEEYANWCSVFCGFILLVLMIVILIMNFDKIGTIQNLSQATLSASSLPKFEVENATNKKFTFKYGIINNKFNLSSTLNHSAVFKYDQQNITWQVVDARDPLYENKV